MKRAHEDIFPPTNGDIPADHPAKVAAGNGAVTSEGATAPAGQSSAGTTAAAPTAAPTPAAGAAPAGQQRKKCPYLDTINRNVLDFDFEKVINIAHGVVPKLELVIFTRPQI